MDWQFLTSIGIVTITLVVFLARLSRRKQGRGCGHGCACGKKDGR